MRILITVEPEIPVPPKLYGGIERIVDGLIKGLVESGHEVTLLANPSSHPACACIPWKALSSRGLKNTMLNSYLLSKVALHNFDIIHSFSRLAYLTPLLPFRIPKIMSYQRHISTKQIKTAIKIAHAGSLIFTACSRYISNQISRIADVYTIYNFVDTIKYNFTLGYDDNRPLVFLGRIEHIKGTHLAVEIARKSGRKLIIAGNIAKEHQEYFDEKVKPYLGKDIEYIGPVDDQQKNELLNQALCLLMPIQWDEPFGIVTIEAMACGAPVIAFPRGAMPEIIQHGVNGYLCHDVEEAISAVNKLNSISRKDCRKTVEEKFDKKVITKQYIQLYQEHIRRCTSRSR